MENTKGSFSTDWSGNGSEFIKQQIIPLSIKRLKMGNHQQRLDKYKPTLKCRYIHTQSLLFKVSSSNKALFFVVVFQHIPSAA